MRQQPKLYTPKYSDRTVADTLAVGRWGRRESLGLRAEIRWISGLPS